MKWDDIPPQKVPIEDEVGRYRAHKDRKHFCGGNRKKPHQWSGWQPYIGWFGRPVRGFEQRICWNCGKKSKVRKEVAA